MPYRYSIFRNSAVRSGLVAPEQLEAAVEILRRRSGGVPISAVEVSDEELASELVAQQLLTKYQCEQLAAGRTKLDLGDYLITDFIGQGGMGQVFKAVHKLMGRVVAIKVLPRSRSTPDAIANFAREIRTQAKLDHPNLVRAEYASRDGNVYYLVTEYVPGSDLRRLVRTQGKLSMPQAASVISQAALGLQYAHDSGLIHRDVKPGNILVTPEGVAKVSDLGLAGFLEGTEVDPRAGKVVGTADYMSPEQIKTPREVAPASDIYSLGCTLYYAITGKVPFPGGTLAEKAKRHCEETPWHPRKFNPDVSEEFVEVLADMMEKDSRARIQSAREVIARLEPWAAEAVSLPSQRLMRARWMAPAVPNGLEEDGDEGEADTQDSQPRGSEVAVFDARSTEGSQGSQPTPSLADPRSLDPRNAALFGPPGLPPPIAESEPELAPAATMMLAVVIPLAMLGGAVLTLFIEWLAGR